MKVSKQDQNKIIAGCLKMLKDAVVKVPEVAMGYELMKQGETHVGAKLINGEARYTTGKLIDSAVKVNHSRAIKKLIASARNKEEMEDTLAAYVVKFGIEKEELAKVTF